MAVWKKPIHFHITWLDCILTKYPNMKMRQLYQYKYSIKISKQIMHRIVSVHLLLGRCYRSMIIQKSIFFFA